ncbi:Mediator of RNA polymerase II transcription subunit 28 [Orchesella cincta]|uniref:Mediator of RNA polymerase II transcription subunit 28 n=1 Tax=Orchesella cincta TaxID=48709 RepID=A0A1D2N983_ORCCI|nr:Mediator of RNA polymerase II transcription subunit 28 [Orchesella cincta]
MNAEITNGTGSNGFVHSNPVDKLEGAFMSCLAAITKEDTLTNVDKDEIRVDVEQGLLNFVDQARSMEGYFLKKRLEIAAQKPELIIKDDASELRFEMVRKDELLKKNYEKINVWQSILADLQSAGAQQSKNIPTGSVASVGVSLPSQGPATPGAQGPLTPSSGRPNTPGSVGRPITPVISTTGSRMHTAIRSQLIQKNPAAAVGFARILPPPSPHFSSSSMEQPRPNQDRSSLQSLLACPAPDIRIRLSEMLTRPVPETSVILNPLHTMEQQQRRNMPYLSRPACSHSHSHNMLPFQTQGETGASGTRSCHISSVMRPPSPSIMPPPPTAHFQYFYDQAGVMMTRTNVPMQLNAHANPHQYPNNCFRFRRNQSEFPNKLPSCTKDMTSRKK